MTKNAKRNGNVISRAKFEKLFREIEDRSDVEVMWFRINTQNGAVTSNFSIVCNSIFKIPKELIEVYFYMYPMNPNTKIALVIQSKAIGTFILKGNGNRNMIIRMAKTRSKSAMTKNIYSILLPAGHRKERYHRRLILLPCP